MLFILIIIIFCFIGIIAIFGDYPNKELKKDYRYYNEIVGRKVKKEDKIKNENN